LWLCTEGAPAIFDYMLNLDLGDFNPSAPAFKTKAKERMIQTNLSDLGSWVRQLSTEADYMLKVGDIKITKDLFTSKELVQFYDPEGKTNVTANGMGRELARAGFKQVLNGNPVKLQDGSQCRLYAVRNRESWESKNLAAIAEHVKAHDKNKFKKY
jgi:hypothetical protein